MRLDRARRVRFPVQSPEKKRAQLSESVSHHVVRVFTTSGRIFASARPYANLLQVCAMIRLFFSLRTICEFREIFSSRFAFRGTFRDGRAPFLFLKTQRRFYEDQSPIVGVCSSYALVLVGFSRNRQHLLRRARLLRQWQLLSIAGVKTEGRLRAAFLMCENYTRSEMRWQV